jgi:hypothetical protein
MLGVWWYGEGTLDLLPKTGALQQDAECFVGHCVVDGRRELKSSYSSVPLQRLQTVYVLLCLWTVAFTTFYASLWIT